MTTVIIDTKRKTIYTDSQATNQNGRKEQVNKVVNFHNIAVTGAGDLKDLHNVAETIRRSSFRVSDFTELYEPFKFKPFFNSMSSIFVVQRLSEDCFKYYIVQQEVKKTWYGKRKPVVTLKKIGQTWSCAYNGYYITGSGASYAIPLLVATGSPKTTIRVISKIDANTDDNVNSFCYEDMT
jgi:20S proteasome alpha/beta subunit